MGNQQLNVGSLVPHKSLLSTLVVKVWRVPHFYNGSAEQGGKGTEEEEEEEEEEGREEVVIVLRHYRRTGQKVLEIDGREVHRAASSVDAGEVIAFEVPLRVGDGRVRSMAAELKIVDFPGLSSYELHQNGRPLLSDTETLYDDDGGGGDNTKRPARRWLWGPVTVPSVTLRVLPSPNPTQAAAAEVAAFYTIAATRVRRRRRLRGEEGGEEDVAQGERRRVVERRFGQFDTLDAMIKGFFHGHHLASSLPSLPPKHLKALTPHNDPAFLESRRQGLQDYLSRLCRFPHLDRHPDVMAFLGFGGGGERRDWGEGSVMVVEPGEGRRPVTGQQVVVDL